MIDNEDRLKDVVNLLVSFPNESLSFRNYNGYTNYFPTFKDEDFDIFLDYFGLEDNSIDSIHSLFRFSCFGFMSKITLSSRGKNRSPLECFILPSNCQDVNVQKWSIGENLKVNREFFDFILSDESPYASMKAILFPQEPRLVKTEKLGTVDINSNDFRFKYGWIRDDLTLPIALMVSFHKMLRLISYNSFLFNWKALLEVGIPKRDAIIMSGFYSENSLKEIRWNYKVDTFLPHSWDISLVGLQKQYLNPSFFGLPIGTPGASFIGCDSIWMESKYKDIFQENSTNKYIGMFRRYNIKDVKSSFLTTSFPCDDVVGWIKSFSEKIAKEGIATRA